MIRCSCLCGGVRLQINGELFAGINCHCNWCQKAHGGAFRSRALARAEEFEVVSGVDLIQYYESTPGVHRGFCSVCGSSLFGKFDQNPDYFNVSLGIVDGDPGVRLQMHGFVDSKAVWYDITDDLPQHSGRIPVGSPGRMPDPVNRN